MKKLIYVFLIASLMIGCKSKEKSQLEFGKIEYKESSKHNNVPKTEVKASIPFVKGDSQAAKNINDKIFENIKYTIAFEGDNSSSYDQLFSGFIKNYEDFVAEFPDYPAGWEATVEGSVEYDSPEILNIKIISYTMTGGAHGNSFTTSLIFNPDDGKELSINNIVKDVNALTVLAEKKFRDKYNIPENELINNTGYMFENNTFSLPANIFVTREGLLLFYNNYEIAAYAEGTKQIMIPYNEIKDNLSVKIN